MATRSFIATRTPDGTYRGVYCHWDGYPGHVGRILRDHYADPDKLATLIDHGDISILGPEIGTAHDFDAHPDDQTTFYGRDRGDHHTGPTTRATRRAMIRHAERCGCEYFYLHDDAGWHYAFRGPQFFGRSDGSLFSVLRPLPQPTREAAEEDHHD